MGQYFRGPHGYQSGRPWAICDRCGFKRRRDTLRKEETGLLVCVECYDPPDPQRRPPVIGPEGLPIKDPRPDYENPLPNTTTRDDL